MAEMTRSEAIDFMSEGTRTAHLATASGSGTPHVAPVMFVVDGDDLVFTTQRGSVKGKNLRANPRAAVTVDEDTYPYSFVIVKGPVEFVDRAPDLLHWTIRIAERYVPEGMAEKFGGFNNNENEMLCRLRMERVIATKDMAL
jgi:PPOX class probable F420-dependent enzyme